MCAEVLLRRKVKKKKKLLAVENSETTPDCGTDTSQSKKTKKELSVVPVDEEQAQLEPQVTGDTKHRAKKRKTKQSPVEDAEGTQKSTKPAAPVGLTDEHREFEEQRKVAQREISQLVAQMRKEGKGVSEIEEAKRGLKRKFGPLRKPDGAKAKKAEKWFGRYEAEEEKEDEQTSLGLEAKHDVVVIPVVWRGRHDHQQIDSAAKDVKQCLAQQGVDVWIDSRRRYTPGQKFAHWEHRGCMLRVEIGPEDLNTNSCQVCLSKTPGDYKSVDKRRVPLPPSGVRKLLLVMKEFGLSQIDIEHREGDSDEDDEGQTVAAVKTEQVKKDFDDLGGNWAPRVKKDDQGIKVRTKNKQRY